MKKKIFLFIVYLVFVMPLISNTVYCQENNTNLEKKSYYPIKVEDLKDKQVILDSIDNLKRIRGNVGTISIYGNTTKEQLDNIENSVNFYLTQFNEVRNNLENYKLMYPDSFSDVSFSEQIIFITDSFILSTKQQQNLIIQMKLDNINAKKIFNSEYLIPAYYYLTLGDQMLAYIENYLIIS